MSKASKFHHLFNVARTTRPAYSRRSAASDNAASQGRQLQQCMSYSKHVFQRGFEIVADDADGSRFKEMLLEDVGGIGAGLAPLPEPSSPSWIRPSFQEFLGKAHAVRVGILVVRNVGAALREAAITAADVHRAAAEAIARLRQLFSAPATQPVGRDFPIAINRLHLHAEMVEAGRKRFLGYLAMERAKKVNGHRCNRVRRFIAARPNRT